MSRVLKRLAGSGTGGNFNIGIDRFKGTANIQPLKEQIDLLLLASCCRNKFIGGSFQNGIDGSASGDKDLLEWQPIILDNTSLQLSDFADANGATLVCQFRYLVRVSNSGISATPKILYGTGMSDLVTVATVSGAAACTATSDAYTGTNQVQTLALTLPTGVKWFKPVLTIGGVPAEGYQVWAVVMFDLYVQSA